MCGIVYMSCVCVCLQSCAVVVAVTIQGMEVYSKGTPHLNEKVGLYIYNYIVIGPFHSKPDMGVKFESLPTSPKIVFIIKTLLQTFQKYKNISCTLFLGCFFSKVKLELKKRVLRRGHLKLYLNT